MYNKHKRDWWRHLQLMQNIWNDLSEVLGAQIAHHQFTARFSLFLSFTESTHITYSNKKMKKPPDILKYLSHLHDRLMKHVICCILTSSLFANNAMMQWHHMACLQCIVVRLCLCAYACVRRCQKMSVSCIGVDYLHWPSIIQYLNRINWIHENAFAGFRESIPDTLQDKVIPIAWPF